MQVSRLTALALVCLTALSLSFGGARTAQAVVGDCTPDASWGTLSTSYADQVLALVNQHRTAMGLSPLSTSSTLTAAAQWKALHMAYYRYMQHDDPAPPVARTWVERLVACGYSGDGPTGENIAHGYQTPQAVVDGWLDSPEHRDNIEYPGFSSIGIGAAQASNGTWYWTQDFSSHPGDGGTGSGGSSSGGVTTPTVTTPTVTTSTVTTPTVTTPPVTTPPLTPPPLTAPTVTLASAPPSSTTSSSAAFHWTTTGTVTSTTCSLDSGAPTACSSPAAYFGLANGSHTFTVMVANSAGSNSATIGWTVAPVFAPPPTDTPPLIPPTPIVAGDGGIPLGGGVIPTPPMQTASLFVSPSGSDTSPCSQAAPCASLNGAYQVAKAGQTISVAAGTYPNQVIQTRPDLRSLSCTPSTAASCVHIVGSGVTIAGSLEIHGSDVWVDGGQTRGGPYGFSVTGYTDTEADSSSVYPDHVVVSGVHSTSFGVFNSDTVTFEDMDIGPSTISTNCQVLQGPAIENKIGSAGGIMSPVPTNITLDGLVIHDQNGDSGRIASDCHTGGLFLTTANNLTVQNTVFQGNVVYNVQIQNFGDVPAPTNVVFDRDSFGCPVTWLYQGAGCDNQSSIQFDGTFPTITVKNSTFAEGGNAGWGCYAGTCDYSQDSFTGNTFAAPTVTAAALP